MPHSWPLMPLAQEIVVKQYIMALSSSKTTLPFDELLNDFIVYIGQNGEPKMG
jgi:hypothetical protein